MAKILVADDEPDIVALVRGRLARAGHEVIEARNGPEALEVIRAQRPDVVLLDWMMPDLTGLDVCEAIRADPAVHDIRVVMLTARAQEDDLTAAYRAGVDDYVIKPFRMTELQSRIAELLGRS